MLCGLALFYWKYIIYSCVGFIVMGIGNSARLFRV